MRGVGKYFKNKAGLKSINTNQIICSSNIKPSKGKEKNRKPNPKSTKINPSMSYLK